MPPVDIPPYERVSPSALSFSKAAEAVEETPAAPAPPPAETPEPEPTPEPEVQAETPEPTTQETPEPDDDLDWLRGLPRDAAGALKEAFKTRRKLRDTEAALREKEAYIESLQPALTEAEKLGPQYRTTLAEKAQLEEQVELARALVDEFGPAYAVAAAEAAQEGKPLPNYNQAARAFLIEKQREIGFARLSQLPEMVTRQVTHVLNQRESDSLSRITAHRAQELAKAAKSKVESELHAIAEKNPLVAQFEDALLDKWDAAHARGENLSVGQLTERFVRTTKAASAVDAGEKARLARDGVKTQSGSSARRAGTPVDVERDGLSLRQVFEMHNRGVL